MKPWDEESYDLDPEEQDALWIDVVSSEFV